MNFDFPKDTEWILNKRIDNGKTSYEFDIWPDGNPGKSIAYFRRSTAKAMTVAIKRLIKKMKYAKYRKN